MSSEADLKRALVKRLREVYPNFVIWRIEDPTTSGIPDITVVGRKVTSFWEVKHATPKFKVKGIQGRTMDLLAREGLAFYIIYCEKCDGADKMTYIVDPKAIHNPPYTWARRRIGFDHDWVVRQIGGLHHVDHSE